MNNSDILRIRLAAQQLNSTQLQTPHDVVAYMGAMQAQEYNMAKWAIGIRLPHSTDKMVEAAINSGEIIRTHVMRPTWHFVSANNAGWMLDLTAPRIKSAVRSRDKELELSETIFTKSNNIIAKALSGGVHLTRDELAQELTDAKIQIDQYRIGHIMLRAELDKVVCSGAPQGKKQTYALFTERVPQSGNLSKDEMLAKLASRYFASHSPATIQDFVWWSGLTTTEARQGIELIKQQLITEKIGEQTYYIANNYTGKLKTDKSLVHLLPAFDEFIISYKDRKAAITAEHHTKAISSNGIFRPTITFDGQVIGLWKKEIKKSKLLINTHYFETPHPTILDLMEKQFTLYERFIMNISEQE